MRVRLVRLGLTLAAYYLGSLGLMDGSDSAVTQLEATWTIVFRMLNSRIYFHSTRLPLNPSASLSLDLIPHSFPSCKCLAILQDSSVISITFASLLVKME